jgi:hypothetical protein
MPAEDDYDKLSPEEREARDKADRAHEAEEQAGMHENLYRATGFSSVRSICPALPYTWSQELGEVDIMVPVPKGTRARDLIVEIQKKKLSVGLKGQDKIMDGELCQHIKVEDSTWTLRWLACHTR